MADLTGIRRKGNQYEVNVRVKGDRRMAYFPLSTPPETMAAWRTQQKGLVAPTPKHGSFAEDIVAYAEKRATMPSIKQQIIHLQAWAFALGRDRSRHSITVDDMDRVMDRWLTTPALRTTGRSAPEGLSPGTVQKRRGSLMAFFKELNGPKAVNPVRQSKNPIPPKPDTRGVDMATLTRILDAMADWRPSKPKRPSLAKIRARIMAYTGLPPGIIGQLGPDDWSVTAKVVHVPARRKGQGVEARTIPLSAQALQAFRDLHAANGYGPFSHEAFNRVIKRAAGKIGIAPKNFRAYDVRHSFLSHVYLVTRDEATVARLGLHAENSIVTKRYTKAAHQDVDRAAVAAFSTSVAQARREALKPAALAPVVKKRKVG